MQYILSQEELEQLRGYQKNKYQDAIKAACQMILHLADFECIYHRKTDITFRYCDDCPILRTLSPDLVCTYVKRHSK
jgi:hypothetical protein